MGLVKGFVVIGVLFGLLLNASEGLAKDKISLQEAIGIATKEIPGQVTEAALEKDKGIQVYEIEITAKDQSHKKITIDPLNGKLLAVKSKTDDSDEDEEDDND